jgi:hypothetical protein
LKDLVQMASATAKPSSPSPGNTRLYRRIVPSVHRINAINAIDALRAAVPQHMLAKSRHRIRQHDCHHKQSSTAIKSEYKKKMSNSQIIIQVRM